MRRERLVRAFLWSLPFLGICVAVVSYINWLTAMPGRSFGGEAPAISTEERKLAELLRAHVLMLADTIGERNHVNQAELVQAMEYIEEELASAGLEPERETYESRGQAFANLVAEVPGTEAKSEILVLGAHYDSAVGSPGANDNGSGVAALLALAKRFSGKPQRRTLRFVAFVNEEPPHFHTESMGSLVHAKGCSERGDNIVGMIALETMGFFSNEPGSQQYPPLVGLLYPNRGNFIGFIGNLDSRRFVRDVVRSFRDHAPFPSEGAALPESTTGVGWSDHWSFWQFGYPALMVTDTAPFRYPHYHTANDTPDKVDYERLARVTLGLQRVVSELASRP